MMSYHEVEAEAKLDPASGCMSCDNELSRLVSRFGEYLPGSRKQNAVQYAGGAICVDACREDCPTFNGLRDIAEVAVEIETGNFLAALEDERDSLIADKYHLTIGAEDGADLYEARIFDKHAADERTLFQIMAVMYDNVLGGRMDDTLSYRPTPHSQLFVATDAQAEFVGALELLFDAEQGTADVLLLGVNDEHRGKGVASGLMRLAGMFAKNAGASMLRVLPTSDSLDFYKKIDMQFIPVDGDDGELVTQL